MQILNKPETISFIAEQVIRQHKEKNESDSLIKILSEQKSSATKSLSNILKAIEAGIINETTKNRMEELEQTIAQLNEKIIIEKAKAENYLTKEEICYFIPNAIKKNPESMIRILIKQVVVYDDKIEIFYNFTSKNPDDNGRDFTLIKGSDNYPMVEVGRVELPCCIQPDKPSTYLVRDKSLALFARKRAKKPYSATVIGKPRILLPNVPHVNNALFIAREML